MSRQPCGSSNEGCKYWDSETGCFADSHHLYWPRPDYRTHLEKQFRNLTCNVVQLCRSAHDEAHEQAEPAKPTDRFMADMIADYASGRLEV